LEWWPKRHVSGASCAARGSKYQLSFLAPIQYSANAYKKEKEGEANKDTAPHSARKSEKNISTRCEELIAESTCKERR
jgi:hypothetical protein